MSESNYVINELYADGPRRFKRHNYKGHKNRRAKKVGGFAMARVYWYTVAHIQCGADDVEDRREENERCCAECDLFPESLASQKLPVVREAGKLMFSPELSACTPSPEWLRHNQGVGYHPGKE